MRGSNHVWSSALSTVTKRPLTTTQKLSYSLSTGSHDASKITNAAAQDSTAESTDGIHSPGQTEPQGGEPRPLIRTIKTKRVRELFHFHRPLLVRQNEGTFIVTLAVDDAFFRYMSQLRTKYIPSADRRTGAHLILFQALPGTHISSVVIPSLKKLADETTTFQFKLDTPVETQRGFALPIAPGEHDEVNALRETLRTAWAAQNFLGTPDVQRKKLSYTMMDKRKNQPPVDQALQRLGLEPAKNVAQALGLRLYQAGRPWKAVRMFNFQPESPTD